MTARAGEEGIQMQRCSALRMKWGRAVRAAPAATAFVPTDTAATAFVPTDPAATAFVPTLQRQHGGAQADGNTVMFYITGTRMDAQWTAHTACPDT